jgi:endo-1,4-beta-xylanase
VVNEALNENGTFRDSVFFRTLGTDYIPISFKAAAEADPDAKLFYNDFNIEANNAKTDGVVEIVELIRRANVRLDGIGFQSHFIVGQTPSRQTLRDAMARFAVYGLDIIFTELDIRHSTLPANPAAVEQQAQDYVSVFSACLGFARCNGILLWQFTDKYSWIPGVFPAAGDACLFDANFTAKPAFTSVSSLLLAAAATASSTPTDANASAETDTCDDFEATIVDPSPSRTGNGTAVPTRPLSSSGMSLDSSLRFERWQRLFIIGLILLLK